MNQAGLLNEVLKLWVRERANMADRLLESLDDLSVAELDALWADEAQRRDDAMRHGRLASEPAEQVLAAIRASLE